MFVFNNERLQYLLEKLKVQFDNKLDKKQYGIIVQDASNGGLKVVNGTPAIDTEISLADAQLLNPNAQAGNFIEVKDKGLVEVELTPEEYLHFRANFSQNYPMHDRVLTEGKVVDSSREWVKITNLEPEVLDEYFFNKN
jgi:hypothetical protein